MNIMNITEITNLTFENFDPDGNAEYDPNVQYVIVKEGQLCQTSTTGKVLKVLIGIQTIIVLCCIIMQYSRTKSLIRAVFKSIVRTFYEFTYFIHAFFIRRMELIPDDPEFKGSDRFSVVETRDVGTSPLCSADELSFMWIRKKDKTLKYTLNISLHVYLIHIENESKVPKKCQSIFDDNREIGLL